jgi:hypothetical protein
LVGCETTLEPRTRLLLSIATHALSRHHLEHPFVFHLGGQEYRVQYLPGDSDSGMFGGNSNWRGPIWMPVNYLLIESLQKFHHYYGDDFKVECPDTVGPVQDAQRGGRGTRTRLTRIFLRGQDGQRPVLNRCGHGQFLGQVAEGVVLKLRQEDAGHIQDIVYGVGET